jgi:hypothetical protein
VKVRTIKQLLVKFRACPAARKKYGNDSRAFKSAFINAHAEHGEWLGVKLFRNRLQSQFKRFPLATESWWSYMSASMLSTDVDCYAIGKLFRKKANRIKYWPEVRKRLKQLGVRF